jgi:hypothetical protein
MVLKAKIGDFLVANRAILEMMIETIAADTGASSAK